LRAEPPGGWKTPKDDQAGFDVATVVLNAGAAKVYATTVGMLRKNQQVHGTTED
jgi:hypothetical protein